MKCWKQDKSKTIIPGRKVFYKDSQEIVIKKDEDKFMFQREFKGVTQQRKFYKKKKEALKRAKDYIKENGGLC